MPDFSKLYKRPAGVAKRPTALPVSQGEDYPGIVKSFELVEPRPGGRPVEYETIIRFHVGLTGWPDGVAPEDRMEDDPMHPGEQREIDLSRRQLRRDFYDNSLYRLDEFLASLGIEQSGRKYEEVLPEAIGKEVLVEVQQYLNQTSGEVGTQIGRMTGRQ